jgi:uncharacterized protein YlxP (DUF503 family)
MVVASCVITLALFGIHSLKEKRQLIKPLLARLPKEFNVAVAEIDHQDVWQTAAIGVVTVGNDADKLHGLLEKVVAWVESTRPDLRLEQYSIELR